MLQELFVDKTLKPKEKTETIANQIIAGTLSVAQVIHFAQWAKDPVKATCIEALEYATKQNPYVATPEVFVFVTESLTAKAPRIKWESAKVIGNIAHLFTENISEALPNLFENTQHDGTVVRWSAAFALAEILKLNTSLNTQLKPKIEEICTNEEKNSIRKIYLDAIKKIEKL